MFRKGQFIGIINNGILHREYRIHIQYVTTYPLPKTILANFVKNQLDYFLRTNYWSLERSNLVCFFFLLETSVTINSI